MGPLWLPAARAKVELKTERQSSVQIVVFISARRAEEVVLIPEITDSLDVTRREFMITAI
jgi:hypothetical protein